MITLRRVADDNEVPTERGTYRRIVEYWSARHWSGGRRYWAETCCPGCGKVALLGANHEVLAGGVVQPSDVCPFPPCAFHDFIALDDWDRPSTPRREPGNNAGPPRVP